MRKGLFKFYLLVLAALILSAAPAFAQEAQEKLTLDFLAYYGPPTLDGYGSTGFAPIDFDILEGIDASERDLGNGWGTVGAQAALAYSRTIPVFAGDGILFSGNSLEMMGRLELSPVTVEAFASATLTPIAFLQLQAGLAAGTGWSLGFTGMGINPTDSAEPLKETPFGGALFRAWASGTLQFDLASVLPGEWNHIVVQASAKFEYRINTAADKGEAWLWQADEGMNFNGWRHLGSYFLGYQMPLKLDMVGILVETEGYIGEVRDYGPMATSWGSDFVTLMISPLANISFDERNSLTILAQFKSTQDWTDGSTRERSFQQRVYEGRLFLLKRIVLSYTRRLL